MDTTPQTPSSGRAGPSRRFAMMEAPATSFKDVKNELGGTVNDVVLTAVAGALHRLLRYRGDPTKGRTLRAMVPVSVRSEDEKDALGNRVSSWLVDLPVGPMSAKKRLSMIRERTEQLKSSKQAAGAEFPVDI